MIELDEYTANELAAQDRFERQRARALARNPDCRDPEHPGCPSCEETDES